MKQRKNRLNNILKFGVFLFGISLLLWNCNQELFQENNQKKIIYKTSYISFETFNQNSVLRNSFEKLSKKEVYVQHSNYLQKEINSNDNTFTILTDLIFKVSNTDRDNYTFKIKNPKNPNALFENFVVEKKDSIIRFFIYEYFYNSNSENQQIPLTVNSYQVDTNIINIQELDGYLNKEVRCGETLEVVITPVPICNCCGEQIIHPDVCPSGSHTEDILSVITVQEICDYPDTDYDDNTNNNNGNADGNTGVGSNGNAGNGSAVGTIYSSDELKVQMVIDILGYDTRSPEAIWLNAHIEQGVQIFDFLESNNNSVQAKNNAKSALDILSSPLVVSNDLQDFKNEILRMTTHLKQWGNPEDEIFADYIESILPALNSTTPISHVREFYQVVRSQVHNLSNKYFWSIAIPFAESAIKVLEVAILRDFGNLSLFIIRKIPQIAILRSGALKTLVKEVGSLGVTGYTSNTRVTRIITTSLPYSKAREIFSTLTRDAISVTTQSNGAIVADMGANRFITFRSISQSSSGYVASIDLNFPNIWTYRTILKFQ